MGRAVLPGKPGIELHLRPSARARRVTLRVSGVDGRVTVSYPERVGADEALRFAEEKADWIEDHLARRPRARVVAPGQRIPVEGVAVEVVAGTGRGARLEDGRLSVPAGRPGPAAEAFLKALARDRLAEAVDTHAARLGRPAGRLTLRDTRSRWGSCSPAGDLMFSWRLIMAPPAILDYVAAHEVAHLAEMNHGPRFWAAVERLYGDWRPSRAWLRKEGAGLHAYRFKD